MSTDENAAPNLSALIKRHLAVCRAVNALTDPDIQEDWTHPLNVEFFESWEALAAFSGPAASLSEALDAARYISEEPDDPCVATLHSAILQYLESIALEASGDMADRG